MQIESQELPPIGTNAFLVADAERKECIVVDAPLEAYRWATGMAENLDCRIVALVLTHGHWDHILDAHHFAAAGIQVYGHADDRLFFEQPETMASYAIPGVEMKPAGVTHWLEAGKMLELLGTPIEVRHVPGHCPGNVLLYFREANAAFVGDVIFAGSVGRYDLPGGDFRVLERSILDEVYTLPDATVLFPGHGPSTTVAAEKSGNPFVRA